MSIDDICWLDQIKVENRDLVGDKIFYLSYLLQHGQATVPSFVVLPSAFENFLHQINWQQPIFSDLPNSTLRLPLDEPLQLRAIAKSLREEFINAVLPPQLGIKLAEAAEKLDSHALILHLDLVSSQLQTTGISEPLICASNRREIEEGLKKIWAELFRARNLFYWQHQGISIPKLKPIVLIQPLPHAMASGFFLLQEEVGEIQATYGLPLSLIKSENIPDYYEVNLTNNEIISKQLGYKNLAYYPADFSWIDSADLEERGLAEQILQIPGNSPLVKAALLSYQQQHDYVLNDQQLQEITKTFQRINNYIESPLIIFWSLEKWGNDEQIFYLNQIDFPSNNSSFNTGKSKLKTANSVKTKTKTWQGMAGASGKVTAPVHVINNVNEKIREFAAGSILVAPAITPDWIPWISIASGVISEQGGMTSHGAILARELGIPAVIGIPDITKMLHTGDLVLLDGDQGMVCLNPQTDEQKSMVVKKIKCLPDDYSPLYSMPIATQLLVNISQTRSINLLDNLPIDGIGLLRSEMLFWEMCYSTNQVDDSWVNYTENQPILQEYLQQLLKPELADKIMTVWRESLRKFAAALAPKPVFYRALDWRLFDKYNTVNIDEELIELVFDLEINVLAELHQAGYDNINMILPSLRSISEFLSIRKKITNIWEEKDIRWYLWSMAEIPEMVSLLPDYIKAGIDGIAIGTNDLTQFVLGINRETATKKQLDPRHPKVMAVIEELISISKQANIPCTICGDAPSLYPEIIDNLVKWGVQAISVNLDVVDSTYMAIMRSEKRLLLEAARKQLFS